MDRATVEDLVYALKSVADSSAEGIESLVEDLEEWLEWAEPKPDS